MDCVYTCNSSLRNIRKRTCPDPKIIQQYLEQNTGFEGTIPDDGRVCASCYKAQLVILKERVISTDSDLLSLISDLKTRVVPIETFKSADDVINRAMLNTAIHVGEKLLQQECLLLPSVNQIFSSLVSEVTHVSNLCVEENVTARWILSNLVISLQNHLSFTCRVRKHGLGVWGLYTILYKTERDEETDND